MYFMFIFECELGLVWVNQYIDNYYDFLLPSEVDLK